MATSAPGVVAGKAHAAWPRAGGNPNPAVLDKGGNKGGDSLYEAAPTRRWNRWGALLMMRSFFLLCLRISEETS